MRCARTGRVKILQNPRAQIATAPGFVSGHGFSRADTAPIKNRALAPEYHPIPPRNLPERKQLCHPERSIPNPARRFFAALKQFRRESNGPAFLPSEPIADAHLIVFVSGQDFSRAGKPQKEVGL